MAYLQAYAAPGGGWLLDVQSDLIDVIATRVVVPLVPASSSPPPAGRLNPAMSVRGEMAVAVTQSLSAVPASILREPVADLASERDRITAALDMLFHGF